MANKKVLAEIKARKQFEKDVYNESAVKLARIGGVALVLALKDMDFTSEQTRKVWDKFNVHFDSINDGTVSLEELEDVLMDEYKVQIENSRQYKIYK